MLVLRCVTPRVVAGGMAAGAMAGAMLFGATGWATADPTDPAPAPAPASAPPNCTAADLAGVSAGVAAATSVYLFAHPDVNDYFTSLKGQSHGDIADDLKNYMGTNPQVHDDLESIRQPLTDLHDRCD